jgi:hypothetical protein
MITLRTALVSLIVAAAATQLAAQPGPGSRGEGQRGQSGNRPPPPAAAGERFAEQREVMLAEREAMQEALRNASTEEEREQIRTTFRARQQARMQQMQSQPGAEGRQRGEQMRERGTEGRQRGEQMRQRGEQMAGERPGQDVTPEQRAQMRQVRESLTEAERNALRDMTPEQRQAFMRQKLEALKPKE